MSQVEQLAQEQEVNENDVVAVQGNEFDIKNVPAMYGKADQIIAALVDKYKDLTEIAPDDNKAYKELQKGITDCVSHRTGFDKTRKKIKQGAIDFGKAADVESTRLQAGVSVVELRLKAIKQGEDDRREGIRLEAERIERERVGAIQGKINHIKALGVVTLDDTLEMLENKQHDLNNIMVDTTYEELAGVANEALLEARKIVDLAVDHRKQRDDEDAQRRIEQDCLDAERKKLDDEAAERKKADDKTADKRRLEQEAFQKEKDDFEAEKRKDNEAREARELDEREAREKEDQRIRDEQEEKTRREEAEKRAEAQKKADKQREEEAERQRQEKAERLDAARSEAITWLTDFFVEADSRGVDTKSGDSLAELLIKDIESGGIPGIKAEYL